MPHVGYMRSGWIHRIQGDWLMHSGVKGWGDISRKLTATGRLPANLLVKPRQKMERAWDMGGWESKA